MLEKKFLVYNVNKNTSIIIYIYIYYNYNLQDFFREIAFQKMSFTLL